MRMLITEMSNFSKHNQKREKIMGWLNQFTFIMRSSITTIREKIEDPERMLHQLILDMDEELAQVRHSVAGAIADEIQLKRKVDATHKEVDDWLQRATEALKRGDETKSKAALQQKVDADRRLTELSEQHAKQKEQTEKLRRAVCDLEDKIRQARQRRTLLLARLSTADSSKRINNALGIAESSSAFAQFNRLEQRVDRAEALSEAYDRLDDRDPDAEELERQFEAADREEQIRREFKELQNRVQPE